jgi:hypothetical protein
MKGAAGCNAECPEASSECCGTVMRARRAAGAVGKAGGGGGLRVWRGRRCRLRDFGSG